MTKPTRGQVQARDRLAAALLHITEAARLDGGSKLEEGELRSLAQRLAALSTPFDLDQIVARALEQRGQDLGLRPGTAELLMLLDDPREPLALLLEDDQVFRARLEHLDAELNGP